MKILEGLDKHKEISLLIFKYSCDIFEFTTDRDTLYYITKFPCNDCEFVTEVWKYKELYNIFVMCVNILQRT